MSMITQATPASALLPTSGDSAPQGLELRHLRYFVAVADAGTFTHAAERMYIAQPTLSQQIRRLEQIIGTSLLHRRREGIRLTQAGAVLLEDAMTDLPAPLDVMHLGEFEPDAWVPDTHPAASRGVIGLDELAHMEVVHGPRRAGSGTYDHWLEALRTQNSDFHFVDPPFRQSMPMTLAFAASGSPPAAVLTGPGHRIHAQPGPTQPGPVTGADTWGMVPVRVGQCRLTATAALVWNGDLPRQLQQLLFDTADGFDLTAGRSSSA